jgi:hypothetical protein
MAYLVSHSGMGTPLDRNPGGEKHRISPILPEAIYENGKKWNRMARTKPGLNLPSLHLFFIPDGLFHHS